jgi:hypothetical protein
MEMPVPERVLSALGDLRWQLRRELDGLVEKRSPLERERLRLDGQLQALNEEIEPRQRALELLEATERQLAGQGRGQPDVAGRGPGASTQVRGYSKPS